MSKKPPESGELKALPLSQAEKCSLEFCDKILESLQDYLRGECRVSIIRDKIVERLTGMDYKESRTKLPTPRAGGTPRTDAVNKANKFRRELYDDGKTAIAAERSFNELVQLILERKQFEEQKNLWAEQSTLNASRWQEAKAELTTALARVTELEKANKNLFKIKQATVVQNVYLKKQLSQ